VVADRPDPSRDPGPDSTHDPEAQTPVERAYALARAGCSDAEIVATLADETGTDPAEIGALVAHPEMARQLEAKRLAGRGAFRAYAFELAQTSKPTSATISLAMWLSRQTLGYSTAGIGRDIEDALGELDGMSRDELKAHLRKVADDL
jgi:hypothetical protein